MTEITVADTRFVEQVEQASMDGANLLSPVPSPGLHPDRPAPGFLLGMALMFTVLASLGCIFSCIYHWERLRSLLSSEPSDVVQDEERGRAAASPTLKAVYPYQQKQEQGKDVGWPVIMPGDAIPKFFAKPRPCSCQESIIQAAPAVESLPAAAPTAAAQQSCSHPLAQAAVVVCT